jgi:hypothetical protein
MDCYAWSYRPTGGSSKTNRIGCYLFGTTYNKLAAKKTKGWTSGVMTASAAFVPPPNPPPLAPLPSGAQKYATALKLSALFYAAQRSGKLPADNPIPWRGDSHLDDPVVGGWYDAGNFIKTNFPLGTSVSFLNWAMLTFPKAFTSTGLYNTYLDTIRVALDYLLLSYNDRNMTYVGQVADAIDDGFYWGRPEQEHTYRPGRRCFESLLHVASKIFAGK